MHITIIASTDWSCMPIYISLFFSFLFGIDIEFTIEKSRIHHFYFIIRKRHNYFYNTLTICYFLLLRSFHLLMLLVMPAYYWVFNELCKINLSFMNLTTDGLDQSINIFTFSLIFNVRLYTPKRIDLSIVWIQINIYAQFVKFKFFDFLIFFLCSSFVLIWTFVFLWTLNLARTLLVHHKIVTSWNKKWLRWKWIY